MPDSYVYLPEIFAGSSSADQHGIGDLKVNRVDVSPATMQFITCGGTERSDLSSSAPFVSASDIQEDLKRALNFLYNIDSFSVKSAAIQNNTEFQYNFLAKGQREPVGRLTVDDSDGVAVTGLNIDADSGSNTKQNFSSPGVVFGTMTIGTGVASRLTRMYNGDVTDEDNFIGYGVSGFTDALTGSDLTDLGGSSASYRSALQGSFLRQTGRQLYFKALNYANTDGFAGSGDAFARTIFDNVTFDETHFMCLASGTTFNIGTPPPTVSLGVSGGAGAFGVSYSNSTGDSFSINMFDPVNWF